MTATTRSPNPINGANDMDAPTMFDELQYVTTPGLSGESIEEEDRKVIHEIRNAIPEVRHWGDLAVWLAYMNFSQDRFLISWEPFRLEHREMFLEYLSQQQSSTYT